MLRSVDKQPRDAIAAYREAARLLELSLELPPAAPATAAEDRINSLTGNHALASQVRQTLESGQSARFNPSRQLPADWLKRLVTLLIQVEQERRPGRSPRGSGARGAAHPAEVAVEHPHARVRSSRPGIRLEVVEMQGGDRLIDQASRST